MMRAKFIFEFERGLDPKEAMGIGRLADIPMEKIHNSAACAKNYSFEDLENIYKRVRARTNIKLDGVPVEDLSHNEWVIFNNKIVNGIKALRRKKTKTEYKFSEGELLKAEFKGKTYFGQYKGVDRNGRIQALGHKIKLAFSPERYTKANEEEIEAFIREGIAIQKRRKREEIERYKRWVQEGKIRRDALEKLIQEYEAKFKEKYI